MNSEIKFRVWDCVASHMLTSELIMIENGKAWCKRLDGKSSTQLINPKIMQFTGMLDNQAIEIYEGDIIKHDGGFGSVLYVARGNCSILSYALVSLKTGKITYMDHSKAENYEVISNIYENKELLEGN